ncbi:hypothetical protein TNCV_4069141 [Trichonephila clavipes]|nr:hypothetical protein TNCV_4069141 [Trichonephila clavipes]
MELIILYSGQVMWTPELALDVSNFHTMVSRILQERSASVIGLEISGFLHKSPKGFELAKNGHQFANLVAKKDANLVPLSIFRQKFPLNHRFEMDRHKELRLKLRDFQ